MSKFVTLPIDEIVVGDRFRKEYGDVDALAENIKEFKQLQPVSINEKRELLAGGRRIAALRLAGIPTVDCVIHSTESELDLRQIELVENVFRKDLTWQERGLLEARILELRGTHRAVAEAVDRSRPGVSRTLAIVEAANVIPELLECKTEDEAWKKLSKVREGIVVAELAKRARANVAEAKDSPAVERFRWADNHYIIGDAIEQLYLLNEGAWDFAEVDPPYGIDLHEAKMLPGESIGDYHEVPAHAYEDFLTNVALGVHRALGHDAFAVWWFGPSHFATVHSVLSGIFPSVSPIPAIWTKGNQGQTQQPDFHLANCYEMFFVVRKGQPRLRKPGRSNVFDFAPMPASAKWHPTQRPPELIDEILDTFVWPGQRVLVPFLGSGQTLLSSYRKDLLAVGFDKSDGYKDRFLLEAQELAK